LTTNDVATVTADGASIESVHIYSVHFSQDNAMVGLEFGQRVVERTAYVEVLHDPGFRRVPVAVDDGR
jgi:hypothetical protein